MIQIKSDQVAVQFMALFSADMPSRFRCFAVLAGQDSGKIITDDLDHPTWGIVWEAGDGTLYLGGALEASLLEQMIALLRHEGDVLVGFWEGDPVRTILPLHPDYVGTTLEFLDRPDDSSGLDSFLSSLHVGYEIHRMNHQLLQRCAWYEDTVRRHGSAECFLEKGLGMCLLHDGVIVSEAYAGPRVMGTRELGAITREEYCGRGLATITCAHLIRACECLGDRTYWNCASANKASAAVARKLGYQTEREYQLFAWLKS